MLGTFSDQHKSIADILKHEKNILLAYIFGSSAKSNSRSPNDIDIAIMLNNNVHGMKKLEFINALSDKLSSVVKRPIDIVILNSAAPALKQQVIKYGYLLFEKKGGLARKLIVDTITAYLDYLNILNFFYAKTIKRKS